MVIILTFQNDSLDGKHGLFEAPGSLGVHILAEHTGRDPLDPYNPAS
ncbi:MAG: hypothetical protein UR11_C0001G0361 [Candidatus Woesebacteria bacterium GW2011_GWC1_30_29]|uniref:Uncharacterized protein n=1 Tax=Candidatus Woesebacteria bacterium GW2011_GWC2_31_9 TaxID=1618586 RepID=A0A0F9YLQ6_9BACT|nr:MAG: hypothetical protein UR11_C0001G0361 [Candidatus Woesebacteria bacterium GW2011_GWC1_30_29]KKP25209.1 MAG: hypothetical protein UR13_C0010G0011 [Candidatus Woesebacteria bacterium GW2011_GWD1_31_12]KKP27646.1 MAG: hypothetical protein UR16_C0003G0306 [Candidatus Woesebacteria bacterium GW2011_GWB1_31_29]KKP32163.1 MAG: hypothetical protein UR21_C0002G0082 [Candidatus Woesebacteria bacterium GW2011_GWC2_31_9]KKP32734.1 MAG: hypothetical protein UR20_C0019G0017 [Candidatus Woesebacteria b